MACDTHDIARDRFMLTGALASQGYDWWWHSFTGHSEKTGEERSFFIEFFCINPALGKKAPVFGQLPLNKELGTWPSYVMVKCGTWGKDARQIHRFFGWDEVEVGTGTPFYVQADDCFVCETDLIGEVNVSEQAAQAHPEWMCDGGQMIWDLYVDKQIPFNVGYGASTPMRSSEVFEMYWHAEGMKTAYDGFVIYNGERFRVDPATCYGYADKNWGRDFTSPWVWLSSNNLVSNRTGKRLGRSAFEVGGGRPKVGPLALDRKLLGSIVHEGAAYEFNFSKPWTGSTAHFDCRETQDEVIWHVELETFNAFLKVDASCPKDEMLLVNYEAPNGDRKHDRLWNGGTGTGRVELYGKRGGSFFLIDDIAARNIGCEYGVYDEDL